MTATPRTCLGSVLVDFVKGPHTRVGQEMESFFALPLSTGLHQCLRSSRHGGVPLLTCISCRAAHIAEVVGQGCLCSHPVVDLTPGVGGGWIYSSLAQVIRHV